MHGDAVVACADLIGRTGATGFELGYLHDDVPVEEAGWYAHANYRGTRLMTDQHRSPSAAALALAERVLAGGMCRCGQPVTLDDDRRGCRWQLMGKRWEPGCDTEPIHMAEGSRGDLGAMQQQMNRRARRAAQRKRRT
jgi:hypothetical protein